MRVGIVGLAALYWPLVMGKGRHGRKDVQFLSAATLGVNEATIQATLGMSATAYIDLILHLMVDKLKTVFAQYGNFTSPGSPFMNCGRIELRLAQGGLASFDMYFCNRAAYPSWQLEIVGPQGVISLHRVAGDFPQDRR